MKSLIEQYRKDEPLLAANLEEAKDILQARISKAADLRLCSRFDDSDIVPWKEAERKTIRCAACGAEYDYTLWLLPAYAFTEPRSRLHFGLLWPEPASDETEHKAKNCTCAGKRYMRAWAMLFDPRGTNRIDPPLVFAEHPIAGIHPFSAISLGGIDEIDTYRLNMWVVNAPVQGDVTSTDIEEGLHAPKTDAQLAQYGALETVRAEADVLSMRAEAEGWEDEVQRILGLIRWRLWILHDETLKNCETTYRPIESASWRDPMMSLYTLRDKCRSMALDCNDAPRTPEQAAISLFRAHIRQAELVFRKSMGYGVHALNLLAAAAYVAMRGMMDAQRNEKDAQRNEKEADA